MIDLSVLIPSTPDRFGFLLKLMIQFDSQLELISDEAFTGSDPSLKWTRTVSKSRTSDHKVEILILTDDKKYSIGQKRNWLLGASEGEYIEFIDSDDRIGEKHFEHAFVGISKGVDACGLTGIITEDGLNPKKFVHSMRYDSWYEKDGVYYRNNNHLNVVKASIAKQMRFPETSQGEDHSYSKQLLASGLIKTEYWDENEVIYYYDFISKK